MLGVELIEGEYDYEAWIEATRGLEDAPEKGERCSVCFDKRLEVSAQMARELGHDKMTTTLLTSPKKSFSQLCHEGENNASRYGIEFVAIDLRKSGGTQKQNELAKKDQLYRQNYCGCLYALDKQRTEQNTYAKELISPLNGRILPNAIEEKIEMYEKREMLEKEGIPYKITKINFLNYRQLRAYVQVKKQNIPAYFLSYSQIKREYTRGKILYEINDVHYFARDEVKFISLAYVNNVLNTHINSMTTLIYQGLPLVDEQKIRDAIDLTPYSKSTIIVLENIDFKSCEIYCKSETFDDVRENLVTFR